jgi:hypothetical protein
MADDGNRLRTTSFVDPAQAQADKDFDPLAGAMDGMNVSGMLYVLHPLQVAPPVPSAHSHL